MIGSLRSLFLFLAFLAPVAAGAQPAIPLSDALRRDAAEYAATHGWAAADIERRLALQEASVPVTDALAAEFADRLTGIVLTTGAGFAIDVLLTGTEPVAERTLRLGDMPVPVRFRVGAPATRRDLLAAIDRHQREIRAAVARPPAMGIDPRTGELVVMVAARDVAAEGSDTLRARLAAIAGVPVRLAPLDRPLGDMGVEGGARVAGIDPRDGKRYVCTTGFVVTDGTQAGVVTAAHCPDALDYVGADRARVPLSFVGQWGWGFQDVQVHATPLALHPVFFADTAKSDLRPVDTWRNRSGTRVGDIVCHRGERTGYSCSDVLMTDFAPAGDLCGGDCKPTWVAVDGPGCRGGDSGGPVFLGTTAIGLLKGGSYRADGSCAFYYYMSTDYLPDGWRLRTAADRTGGGLPMPVPPID